MEVLKDYWREYTEEEKKTIEWTKKQPVNEIGDDIKRMLKRGKKYRVDLPDGYKVYVDVEEFCLDWKHIRFSLVDRDGIEKVHLGLAKGERGIKDCVISIYELPVEDGKRVSMHFKNYDYWGNAGEWVSFHEEWDYRITDEKGRTLREGKLKDLEGFAKGFVERAFSNFDLLVEGRAKEWLEDCLFEVKELLYSELKKQSKNTLRR